MTTPEEDAAPTPESVAHAANIGEALPLDRTTLLGIYFKGDSATALLRTGSGEILTVVPGDVIADGRVAAISPDTLYLEVEGVDRELTLPQS